MRKGETLEQEAARRKAEAELPERLQRSADRITAISEKVKALTEKLKYNNRSNAGGENNGKML